jgi:hypothetical protein
MVPAHLGRDQVEVIIAEEKTHLANLTRELRRATGA